MRREVCCSVERSYKKLSTVISEIFVADIGGTHARFAIANIGNADRIQLGHQITMISADFMSLQEAMRAYGNRIHRDLPKNGTIAVAAPIEGKRFGLPNNNWVINPALIQKELELLHVIFVNDFGAIGHAVASSGDEQFLRICGPDDPVSNKQSVAVVGPGTGLGLAQISRKFDEYSISETEAGHIDFAPLDEFEDRLLKILRKKHGRVSVERVVSGPGLQEIYALLAEDEGQRRRQIDDRALWLEALSGKDDLAVAAFDRFCRCLGSFAGDMALAHGAEAVVISGGLGNRLLHQIALSGFCDRFINKGRFKSLMKKIPVVQFLNREPGLYGAAAAFLRQYTSTK